MLTVELVRARRRGQTLELLALKGASRERAASLAGQYIALVKSLVGQTRGEVEEALSAVPVEARDRKVAAGLRKLVLDRCEFEVSAECDPAELRREVFGRASRARKALTPGVRFVPDSVLVEVAAERGIGAEEVARMLYADLRSAHLLLGFASLSADALVELYELGQAQAVLLRAVRVVVSVRSSAPSVYRAVFHKLKFLRLLYTIAPLSDEGGGYEITIDGPYSLFRSVTKYGLQLALLLPTLRACHIWSLTADIKWGKESSRLTFSLQGGLSQGGLAARPGAAGAHDEEAVAAPAAAALPPLAEEALQLLAQVEERFQAGKSRWRAECAKDVLNLPGVGLCVPDLVFEHADTGERIYLEVLGFWSRAAVWKRVELVESGLGGKVLFAVSSRLRVSEAALADDLPGALYVYKGAMSVRAIEEHLEKLRTRDAAPGRPPGD